MDLVGAVDSFVDSTKSHDIHTAAQQSVFDEVRKEGGLFKLVETLGPYLTSQEESVRSRGTLLLSEVLSAREQNAQQLNDSQKDHLLSFFLVRLDDMASGPEVVRGLFALVMFHKLSSNSLKAVATKLFGDIGLQALPQQARQWIFEIMDHLIVHFPTELKSLGAEQGLRGVVRSMDGERDPRNLIWTFKMHAHACALWIPNEDSVDAALAEEMFDVVSCYYPITFVPPKNDPFGITREQLCTGLSFCLVCSPAFATHTASMLIQKLATTQEAQNELPVKSETIILLRQVVEKFGISCMCNNPEKLRDAIFTQAADSGCNLDNNGTTTLATLTASFTNSPSALADILDLARAVANALFEQSSQKNVKAAHESIIGITIDTITQRNGCSPALTLGIVVPNTVQYALLRTVAHANVSCLDFVLKRCFGSLVADICSTSPKPSSFACLHALICPATSTPPSHIQHLLSSTLPHHTSLWQTCSKILSSHTNSSQTPPTPNTASNDQAANSSNADEYTTSVGATLHTTLWILLLCCGGDEKLGVSLEECQKTLELWGLLFVVAAKRIRSSCMQGIVSVTRWMQTAGKTARYQIDVVGTLLPLWTNFATQSLPTLNKNEQTARELVDTVMEGFVSIANTSPVSWCRVCTQTHILKQYIQAKIDQEGSDVWVWAYEQVLSGLCSLLKAIPESTAADLQSPVVDILNGLFNGLSLTKLILNIRVPYRESIVSKLQDVFFNVVRASPPAERIRLWGRVCELVSSEKHTSALFHVACILPSLVACVEAQLNETAGANAVIGMAKHCLTFDAASNPSELVWHVYLAQTVAVSINITTNTELINGVVDLVKNHPEYSTVSKACPSNSVMETTAWVMKALVLSGNSLANNLITWFCGVMLVDSEDESTSVCTRDALGVVFADSAVLSKNRGAKIKLLSRQRAYTTVITAALTQLSSLSTQHQQAVPKNAIVSSLLSLHCALLCVPSTVVKMDLPKVFDWCVLKSINNENESVREGALATLRIAMEQSPQLVAPHVSSLLPEIIASISAPHSLEVRMTALDVLSDMIRLPHTSIFQHKQNIYRACAVALDDKKRAVRQKAVRCRNIWAL